MPYKDTLGRTCGFLNIEEKEGSGRFVRRYFLLDKLNGQLIYYLDNPSNLAEGNRTALEGINLQLVSVVSDGKSSRPKLDNCFVINHINRKYFLQAEGENDKKEWIEVLNNASKITVPQADKEKDECQEWHFGDTSSGYTAKLAGGVVCKVAIKDSSDEDGSSSDSDDEAASGFTEALKPPIKTGFCVKQGALRKNWKRRYFVLNNQNISYYRSESEKSPLKSIPVKDISDVRPSIGTHSSRDNLFELITSKRTFYVQCDTKEDMFSWIEEIQKISNRMSNGSGKFPLAGSLQFQANSAEKVKPEAKVENKDVSSSKKRNRSAEETICGKDTKLSGQNPAHECMDTMAQEQGSRERKDFPDGEGDSQMANRDSREMKKDNQVRRSKNWFW